MAKPERIELPTGENIPILYEDRSVLAIDKPAGWMLVPFSWQRTNRNLQAALMSSIRHGDHWARSRNLKFLRFVHRLDAETTGILLLAKSPGAVEVYSGLFEGRKMHKLYLAVVEGKPLRAVWNSNSRIGPDPNRRGRMKIAPDTGKDAETAFRLVETRNERSLIEARPRTGRTHQIRLHLAEAGLPIAGDALYGRERRPATTGLGLRAVRLSYEDPFTKRHVEIRAPIEGFLTEYGFQGLANR